MTDLERIYFKDRRDLALAIGHLLGCHGAHTFIIHSSDLSIELTQIDIQCVISSPVAFRHTLAEVSTPITPPPPPPPF